MEIEKYLKNLLRWWWLVLLSTTLAAGSSYYVSLQQPKIYQTTTTLMVGQVIQQANPSGNDFTTTERLAESYAQMAKRQPILQTTVDSLGLDLNWQALRGRVNAYQIPRTQLLGITVEDNVPERAVAIADEIGYQLILQSPTAPDEAARQERGDFVQSQLNDLEEKIEAAKVRIAERETELDAALSARQIQDIQTEIANLESLINNWQANYTELLNFLEGGGTSNYLSVIEPAQIPYNPVSPDIMLNVALAAAAGFVLAVGAALLLEYLDDTVKLASDLTGSLQLAALGNIYKIKGAEQKDKLITAHSPFSSMAENYRLLRTNIQFMTVDQPLKSIMVTSPNPGEGKTITVANLGVIMAQANLKTIIIDADMRRPSVHKIFEVSNKEGLTDLFLAPDLDFEKYLKETTIKNLNLITSGPLPPNPAEMMSSQRMAELLQWLEKRADIVIFDSPPVLAVTDASVLSSRIDGTILVTQAKRTRLTAIRQALERLEQVDANLLGGIVNQVAGSGADYYMAYTRSGSAVQSESAKSRRWWQRLSTSK